MPNTVGIFRHMSAEKSNIPATSTQSLRGYTIYRSETISKFTHATVRFVIQDKYLEFLLTKHNKKRSNFTCNLSAVSNGKQN